MMKNIYLPLALGLLLMSGEAGAKPRTKAQMQEAAATALRHESVKLNLPKKNAQLKTLKETATYSIYGYEEGGFSVVSADDLLPEVLGVSASRYSEGRNENFNFWLRMTEQAASHIVKNGIVRTTTTPEQAGFEAEVPSQCTTKWDQEEPYNRYCPGSGWSKCLTGCVATAMAQVLNYHRMPEHGYGERTIYYPQNNHNGEAVYANFAEHYYDWDNMLDHYVAGQYNDAQAEAVAVLMRDCGVAANMMYGTTAEGGSGAYSEDAAAGLRQYFGLEDAECVLRDSYSEAEWMAMVYTELSEGGPIYYGGADLRPSVYGGHAFVLDGYRADGMVSVNWGWSGDDDGYYDIALLNPSYYMFNYEQDMIIGLRSDEPVELRDMEVTLAEDETLSEVLEGENLMNVRSLKVTGNIYANDFYTFQEMAGSDGLGNRTKGHLEVLDLSEAYIYTPRPLPCYDEEDDNDYPNNALPERAFYGCRTLKTLLLPEGITRYGDGALALCTKLTELSLIPAEEADFVVDGNLVWNADRTELIAALPMASGTLNIPKNTTAMHNYALAGCNRLSAITIPASVATIGTEAMRGCSALSEIRVAGKEVPRLTGGNVFTGVNFSGCQLYVRSGMKTKFSKASQWREFADNGLDNIVEYGTTIKARNAVKEYGQDNPVLGYQIKGDHVSGTPVITCEANRKSPAGRYVIHIEPGTITDEAVDFEDGYLVVKKATLTATVQDAQREQYQENPAFEVKYSGFRNGEDESVIDVLPVVSTEATADSPMGEYALTISGAEDDCYDFKYVDGTLTVTEATTPPTPTAITAVEDIADQQYYDLQGRPVAEGTAPRGITIARQSNGKARKVVNAR